MSNSLNSFGTLTIITYKLVIAIDIICSVMAVIACISIYSTLTYAHRVYSQMDRAGEKESGPREAKPKSQRVQRMAVFYETSRTEPGTDRHTVQRHAYARTTSSDVVTTPMAYSRSDSTRKSKSLPRSSTVPAFTTSGQPQHQKGRVGDRAKYFESMIRSEEDGTSAARTTAMKKPASMNYGQYSHDSQKCECSYNFCILH